MKLLTLLRLALLLPAAGLARAGAADPSPLVVISLDGFRWDYCDLHPAQTPTLRTLRREGVTARSLIPVFPSNTFPNHYSIVTGLYPAHHGIVNNDFFDPALGEIFRFSQPNARDPRWWGGEPIWNTAGRQGLKTATSFWVGSDSAIAGQRPDFWRVYDPAVTFETRLAELIGWLRLPLAKRPSLIAVYLEPTNAAGHRFGPESPEVTKAIATVDDSIARLLAGIRGEGLEPNLIIVSDHGMTATSLERAIVLDDIIDVKTVQFDSTGSVLSLRPNDGDAAALVRRFEGVAHVKAYRAEELPGHFHFRGNPRIAPVWVLPDEGWHIGPRAAVERLRQRYSENGYMAGDHGYDPALTSMRGIFIAHGPAFRRGVELPEFENVHLYSLMCAVLKITPAKNDGDDRLVKTALAPANSN